MGRGGFEPPKQIAADLQSVPFGHSGICPFIRYTKCALTRKDYSIVASFMQAFFINVLVSCSVIHQNNSRIFLHAYFKHSIHYFILFRHQGITCLIEMITRSNTAFFGIPHCHTSSVTSRSSSLLFTRTTNC